VTPCVVVTGGEVITSINMMCTTTRLLWTIHRQWSTAI